RLLSSCRCCCCERPDVAKVSCRPKAERIGDRRSTMHAGLPERQIRIELTFQPPRELRRERQYSRQRPVMKVDSADASLRITLQHRDACHLLPGKLPLPSKKSAWANGRLKSESNR